MSQPVRPGLLLNIGYRPRHCEFVLGHTRLIPNPRRSTNTHPYLEFGDVRHSRTQGKQSRQQEGSKGTVIMRFVLLCLPYNQKSIHMVLSGFCGGGRDIFRLAANVWRNLTTHHWVYGTRCWPLLVRR